MATIKKYGDYQEGDSVKQAQTALSEHLSQKPGAYQSQWQSQLSDNIDKILNREKFSYDVNSDALYQQYKDKYVQQGKMAMMDTMGQAAALTGGYGSTYAQQVGQQTYQGYLQDLNDKIPELYQLALDTYNQETSDLYNKYSLLSDQENQDYSKYRDTVSDWNTERDYLAGRYDTERNHDYGKFTDDRNLQYQLDRDAVSDEQWQKSFAYQQERDEVSDAQWQKEFDEGKRQYEQSYALKLAENEGSGDEDDKPDEDLEPTETANTKKFVNSYMTRSQAESRGITTNEWLAYIDKAFGSVGLTDGEFAWLEQYYGL